MDIYRQPTCRVFYRDKESDRTQWVLAGGDSRDLAINEASGKILRYPGAWCFLDIEPVSLNLL